MANKKETANSTDKKIAIGLIYAAYDYALHSMKTPKQLFDYQDAVESLLSYVNEYREKVGEINEKKSKEMDEVSGDQDKEKKVQEKFEKQTREYVQTEVDISEDIATNLKTINDNLILNAELSSIDQISDAASIYQTINKAI